METGTKGSSAHPLVAFLASWPTLAAIASVFVDQGKLARAALPTLWHGAGEIAADALQEFQILCDHAEELFTSTWRYLRTGTAIWLSLAGFFLVLGIMPLPDVCTITFRSIGILLLGVFWLTAAHLAAWLTYATHRLWGIGATTAAAVANTAAKLPRKIGAEIPEFKVSPQDAEKLAHTALGRRQFFLKLAMAVFVFGTFWVPKGDSATVVHALVVCVVLLAVSTVLDLLNTGGRVGLILMVGVVLVKGMFYFVPTPPNWSVVIAAVLLAAPFAIAVSSFFSKEKGPGLLKSAKLAALLSAIIFAFLWYRGNITWAELSRRGDIMRDQTAQRARAIEERATDNTLGYAERKLGMTPSDPVSVPVPANAPDPTVGTLPVPTSTPLPPPAAVPTKAAAAPVPARENAPAARSSERVEYRSLGKGLNDI